MNVLLRTGDRVKFKLKKDPKLEFEGSLQISRNDQHGIHYTVGGEHYIINLDLALVTAVKRNNEGEWIK